MNLDQIEIPGLIGVSQLFSKTSPYSDGRRKTRTLAIRDYFSPRSLVGANIGDNVSYTPGTSKYMDQAYRLTWAAQNSANAVTFRGGLVWCGRTPSASGVKQNVSVTSNGSSASIWRSNQASAPGRWLSAQLSPVRRCFTPRSRKRPTASSSLWSWK